MGKDMMKIRKTDVRYEEKMAVVINRWMTKGSVDCIAKRDESLSPDEYLRETKNKWLKKQTKQK